MLYFLSSIPRSGSTLLASLLSQRPDTYVSPTSNLNEILSAVLSAIFDDPATQASNALEGDTCRIMNAIIKAKYSHCKESVIFDKHRGWAHPDIMKTMKRTQGKSSKVIATVRPIAECVVSFYLVDTNKDISINDWLKTVRGKELVEHTKESYVNLRDGFEAHPENFCLIEYDNLCNNPQQELDRIADFIGIEKIEYKKHIDQVEENDEAWGIKNLHKLGSTINKTEPNAREILGEKLFAHYQGGEFWNDKPEPAKIKFPIDISLEASLHGDFKKSWEIVDQIDKDDPSDDRSAFNRGWHLMQQGKLLEGHKYINRGRNENVFGNQVLSTQPAWDGKSNGTILLVLEGGLGDQFHGFRYAQEIKNMGHEVVIACSIGLAEIFSEKFVCIRHEAIGGVYHDYYIQSMSAPLIFRNEYADVRGESYIDRTAKTIKGRVGVRWSGLPQYEHQQYRIFPHELMFDTVKDLDCVSLQRDDGAELRPEWMPQADVSDWVATRKSISECELVITSCTSVAHLAGAMGVKTWIVVPILPYYLWALPSNKTPYYNSVQLFRQEKYGWWESPFIKMTEILNTKQSKTFEYGLKETLPEPAFM